MNATGVRRGTRGHASSVGVDQRDMPVHRQGVALGALSVGSADAVEGDVRGRVDRAQVGASNKCGPAGGDPVIELGVAATEVGLVVDAGGPVSLGTRDRGLAGFHHDHAITRDLGDLLARSEGLRAKASGGADGAPLDDAQVVIVVVVPEVNGGRTVRAADGEVVERGVVAVVSRGAGECGLDDHVVVDVGAVGRGVGTALVIAVHFLAEEGSRPPVIFDRQGTERTAAVGRDSGLVGELFNVRNEDSAVVLSVHQIQVIELTLVGLTGNRVCLVASASERGQQHRDQNGDDSDHHQQLHECEAFGPFHRCLREMTVACGPQEVL